MLFDTGQNSRTLPFSILGSPCIEHSNDFALEWLCRLPVGADPLMTRLAANAAAAAGAAAAAAGAAAAAAGAAAAAAAGAAAGAAAAAARTNRATFVWLVM